MRPRSSCGATGATFVTMWESSPEPVIRARTVTAALAGPEDVVRRLALAAERHQPAVHAEAVLARRVVVQREPAERVDPLRAARDLQGVAQPGRLELLRQVEGELVVGVVGRPEELGQEQLELVASGGAQA